jgi:hypothetical protein
MKTKARQVADERKLSPKAGFALVVTLSLMILLTVIAVGLLTLSSVSLRQAGASNAMVIAQNNARLAMMLALGELQSQVGPDQRVTGIADLAGSATGEAIQAGANPANPKSVNGIDKGLSSVQPGTRYWTGVWKHSATNPGTEIFTITPSPVLTKWLISGNEGRTLADQITPASQAHALNANGDLPDPQTTALLAGRNSIGSPSAANLQRYVSAPLVPIRLRDSKLSGRYAWWIGDEGVKARINLAKSNDDAKSYASITTRRRGWETLPGFLGYPDPSSPLHESLPRVITLETTELLLPGAQTSSGSDSALRSAFHSATTDSRGVITDTLNGGTRIDLSAILRSPLPSSSPITSVRNYPVRNGNIIPSTVARSIRGPKWDQIVEFQKQAKSMSGDRLVVKAAANDADLTFAPIISDLRILMGVKIAAVDATTYRLHPCGKVAVALANPYPYTLEWNKDIELTLIDETRTSPTSGSAVGNANYRTSRIWDAAGLSAFFSPTGAPAVFNNATFVIPRGELPPGEARAYTQSGQIVRSAGSTSAIRVDMRPFSSASPSNLNFCIIQEDNTANTGNKLLDVRESWTTTQISAELRLAGSSSRSNPLRRIERFELDNGFFSSVRRPVTRATANTMREPFPLHVYSYQISQPGSPYVDLLPAANLLGTRSSTLRTFMDFNLRATRFRKLITSYNPPPYFMESTDSLSRLPFIEPGGITGDAFTKNLAVNPLYWGRSSNTGVRKTVLFSLPDTLVSLAQLQHVDLTADDLNVSISQQPGNAVGNSYATPFVRRKFAVQPRQNYYVLPVSGGDAEVVNTNYYDISYLLNAALWDTYFFSTYGDGAPGETLNRNIVVGDRPAEESRLNDPLLAASHFMIDGAFNINSTSKDAWKALLAGNRFLKHPADGGGNLPPDAMFPRSLTQTSPAANPPTAVGDDAFSGFRRLTDDQIDAVAEEIVKQVRLRGPFVSLSHFVNRALVDLTARNTSGNALSRSGALQSALDEGGANISFDGQKSAFQGASLNVNADRVIMQLDDGNAPKADLWGTQKNGSRGTLYTGTNDAGQPVWASESKDLNAGSVASIVADRSMLSESQLKNEQGFRSTGIPGWITQADVLQAIGPSIAARSDTFRIRSYGEALAGDGTTVVAKAWCEAIVQRMPSYTDPANAASDRLASPTDTTLTVTNKAFGRKFQIVSFRWLSSNEI